MQSVLTITVDEETKELGIKVEFSPEFRRNEQNPLCHYAAMVAINAIKETFDKEKFLEPEEKEESLEPEEKT